MTDTNDMTPEALAACLYRIAQSHALIRELKTGVNAERDENGDIVPTEADHQRAQRDFAADAAVAADIIDPTHSR